MSWQSVKIKVDGNEYDAMMRGDELFIPMLVEEALPTIEVDGKSREVLSVRVDERDSVVYVTVKPANAKMKRSKSDDEPVEGRDDDNAGGAGV
jgi:hypothetical protein